MNEHETQNMKLVTCVLYQGGGLEVLKHLHRRGINKTALYHARGSAIGDPVARNGLPACFEKEILVIAVDEKDADEIFEMVFDIAKIDRPYGGFLYMEKLKRVTPYCLEGYSEEDPET